MKKLFQNRFLTVIITIFLSNSLSSQIVCVLDNVKSHITVNGTSTIHDWEMKVEKMSGLLEFDDEYVIEKVSRGSVIVPVKSLVSDRSLMNKKAYSALKEEDHPKIKGNFIKINQAQNSYNAVVELTIAGVKKTFTRNFKYTINNNQVVVEGAWKLLMSSFSIDPPEALMGTIKTGDEITVYFTLVFVKK